ncbi:protein RRP5 homolog [Glandiceps talaboti]
MADSREDYFPRGKSTTKSEEAAKDAKTVKPKKKRDDDVLFKEKTVKPKKGKKRKRVGDETDKKKKKGKGEDSRDVSEGVLTVGPRVKTVKQLSSKDLTEGMLLLGAIKEIHDYEMVVSLPHGLTGHVEITDISNVYTKMLQTLTKDAGDNIEEIKVHVDDIPNLMDVFRVGQYVKCAVKEMMAEKRGYRKISLTLDPKIINKTLTPSYMHFGLVIPGVVSSVEDHGYVMDLGVRGVRAFLNHRFAKQFIDTQNEGKSLVVGQLLDCYIKEVSAEGRSVTLTINSNKINKAVANKVTYRYLHMMIPGTKVTGTVTEVSADNATVNFLDKKGVVNHFHFEEFLERPKKNEEVTACVLFNNVETATVGLTLQPSICERISKPRPPKHLRLGKIFKHALVKEICDPFGMFLEVKGDSVVYVKKADVSEGKKTGRLKEKFKIGSKVKCRVIGYNSLDGVVFATMKTSVIDQPFLSQRDVKPGMKIKAKISEFNKFGLVVSITDKINGFIPHLHIADIPLKHPGKKYKEGDLLICRVLTSDHEKRKLVLTHKVTLVDSELPTLTSYDKAEKDMYVHGTVFAIGDYGCKVRFYNNVKGLIPRRNLGDEFIETPEKVFYTGQVLKCRVTAVQPEESKLKLSLKVCISSDNQIAVPDDFEVGKLTKAKVVTNSKDGLQVMVLPSKHLAFLPKMQLSDSVENCDALLSYYKSGDVIDDVMYMYMSKHTELILTKKPVLLKAAEENKLIDSFNDLEVGLTLPGFIKCIMNYGVFVAFPNNVVGLSPKSHMADIFVSDTAEPFQEGQSVMATVLEIDREKKRFLVSLKPSQCCSHHDGGVSLLQQYLQERKMVAKKQHHTKEDVTQQTIGSVIEGVVKEVQDTGLLVQMEDGQIAVIASVHVQGTGHVKGSKVKACVLHIKYDVNIVQATMKPLLIQATETKKGKNSKIRESQTLEATVELVKDDVIITSLKSGQLVMLPGKRHLNDTVRMASDKLHTGQEIDIVIKKITKDGILATIDESKLRLRSRSEKDTTQKMKRNEERIKMSAAEMEKKVGIALGTTVTAVVKSVKDTCMYVVIDKRIQGRVHVSEILDKPTDGQYPLKSYHGGMTVEGRVIGYRDIKHNKFLPITHTEFHEVGLEITLKPSKVKESKEITSDKLEYCIGIDKLLQQYEVGQTVWCYADTFENNIQTVAITPRLRGEIHLLHLSNSPHELESAKTSFKTGQAYKARVMKIHSQYKKLELTRTGNVSLDIEEGSVVNGQVKKILHDRLIVQLHDGHDGEVFLTDLSDNFVNNPLDEYKKKRFLRCYVLDCQDKNHILLSTRQSRLKNNQDNGKNIYNDIQSIDDVQKGDLVKGYVKNNTYVGLFVRLSRSLQGRVELRKMSSFYVNNPSEAFQVNQAVTAKVMSVDKESSKIELSLLPEHTGLEDQLEKKYRGSLRTSGDKEKLKHFRDRQKAKKRRERPEEDGSDSGIDAVLRDIPDSDSDVEIIVTSKPSQQSKVPRLEIPGFSWDEKVTTTENTSTVVPSADDSDVDNEDADVIKEPPKKKTRKEKLQEEKEKEQLLYKTELAMMDPNRTPETSDDFDRLVLSSPDSSLVWIQYMAFHLHTGEVEKARVVAERALKTISFRNEQEKLNVWIAYLNLENMYGLDETLAKVFERALQMCDALKVFKALVNIYNKTEKTQQAEKLYNTMVKRFSLHKDAWTSYGMFLMINGKQEASRKLMQRSFKSLDDKDHIDVIVKFAQFEFKYGEAERGRTMFENTLSNYPKRTDIWSIYIDMMIKQDNKEVIRQLFERVIHLNLSPKKIKFFFKRYLDYEKKHGDDGTVAAVKQKALEYVESKTGMVDAE